MVCNLRARGLGVRIRLRDGHERALGKARLSLRANHGRITTFDHVVRVAALSLRIARRLPVSVSETELARGALLHDYYLYD